MSILRFVLAGSLLSAVLGATVETGLAAQVVPTGFATEFLVGEPFTGEPVGFAILPDGRRILVERSTGSVRLAVPGSSSSAVIATIPGIEAVHPERGLLAVAVDSDWPARPYLYFYYNHVSSKIFLTMYTASGSLSDAQSLQISLGAPFHLLTDIPDVNGIHNGGSLRFGPDGMLYVSVGDDGQSCPAQDLSSLLGSILRLDVSDMPGIGGGPPPKSAITPPDNPFPGPNDNARLRFAWGLRNPFRFTIDPSSGDLTIGDVGSSHWEEINHLDVPQEAGANFAWPQMEGHQEIFCCGDCGDGNTFTAPVAVMQHVGIISIVGGPVLRGNLGSPISFPASYEGNILFFEVYSGVIRRLVENAGAWSAAPPVPGQPDALNWGTGHVGVCDAQMGSDGAVYFLCLGMSGVPRGLYRVVGTTPTAIPESAASSSPICTVSPNPLVATHGANFAIGPTVRGAFRIALKNIEGRLVRRLSGRSDGGARLEWDGRDETGKLAAPGVYVWSLTQDGDTKAFGKITILR